jgi:thiosulfate/3-mercaptopyruvate sulfurtransferase
MGNMPVPLYIDVRPIQAYRAGHLPGAIQLDLSPLAPRLHTEADLAAFEQQLAAVFGQIGVVPHQKVVAYDQGLTGPLARTAFFLALGGLEVELLTDGWQDQAIQTDLPQISPTAPWAQLDRSVLLTLPEAAVHPRMIDVRRSDEFVAGHLPGAQHHALDRFGQPSLLAELGLKAGDEVGVYCRSGSRSAVAFWVLRAQGVQARNYLGSMLDWEASGQPVER